MKVNSNCIRHKLAYMQLLITVSGSTVNVTAVTEPLMPNVTAVTEPLMPTTTSSTPASVSTCIY